MRSARRKALLKAGNKNDSTVGEVYFRAADHQLVRPVVIVRGKKPADMKNAEDFWEVRPRALEAWLSRPLPLGEQRMKPTNLPPPATASPRRNGKAPRTSHRGR